MDELPQVDEIVMRILDGGTLTDAEAVQCWIDAFNARPFVERDEFLRDRTP